MGGGGNHGFKFYLPMRVAGIIDKDLHLVEISGMQLLFHSVSLVFIVYNHSTVIMQFMLLLQIIRNIFIVCACTRLTIIQI